MHPQVCTCAAVAAESATLTPSSCLLRSVVHQTLSMACGLLLNTGCSSCPKDEACFCTFLCTFVESAHTGATLAGQLTVGIQSQLAKGTACTHAATAEAAERLTGGWPEQRRRAACGQCSQRVNVTHFSSYCRYTSMLVVGSHCHVHLLSLQLPLQHPRLPTVQSAPIAPLPIAQPAHMANGQ